MGATAIKLLAFDRSEPLLLQCATKNLTFRNLDYTIASTFLHECMVVCGNRDKYLKR